MTTHNDFLIGRIALERGLISVDQLAECLNDQKASSASTLGAVMLRKGLIKQRDLDTLLDTITSTIALARDRARAAELDPDASITLHDTP